MRRAQTFQTFQTCSSILVAGGSACAEMAAHFLDRFPGSSLAWYLNVAVFSPFEQARAVASPLNPLVGSATLGYATILVLLALAAGLARSRLSVALITHLAFAASFEIARAWLTSDRTGEVSLAVVQDRSGAGTCLVGVLLVTSGLACALSHVAFALAIRADDRNATRSARSSAGITSLETLTNGPVMSPS